MNDLITLDQIKTIKDLMKTENEKIQSYKELATFTLTNFNDPLWKTGIDRILFFEKDKDDPFFRINLFEPKYNEIHFHYCKTSIWFKKVINTNVYSEVNDQIHKKLMNSVIPLWNNGKLIETKYKDLFVQVEQKFLNIDC